MAFRWRGATNPATPVMAKLSGSIQLMAQRDQGMGINAGTCQCQHNPVAWPERGDEQQIVGDFGMAFNRAHLPAQKASARFAVEYRGQLEAKLGDRQIRELSGF